MKKFKIKSIVIVVVLLYVCYILINQQIIIKSKKAQLSECEMELEKVNKEHQRLLDESKISDTVRYVEKLARERLSFIKQGERVVGSKND